MAEIEKGFLQFCNLPNEIRLQIWEKFLETPRVHRISTNHLQEVTVTPKPLRSTAAARAALSVSRRDRGLILRYILPDEIPMLNYRWPGGVLRYNASKDVICLTWRESAWFLFQTTKLLLMTDNTGTAVQQTSREKPAWMTMVEKLALEIEVPEDVDYQTFLRYMADGSYRRIGSFKQMFIVVLQSDAPPVEDTALRDERRHGTLEVSLDVMMNGKIRTPTPERNYDAFLHSGTYAGTRSTDRYLSGTMARKWLEARRIEPSSMMRSIEQYSEKREKATSMPVGILLHVLPKDDRWACFVSSDDDSDADAEDDW